MRDSHVSKYQMINLLLRRLLRIARARTHSSVLLPALLVFGVRRLRRQRRLEGALDGANDVVDVVLARLLLLRQGAQFPKTSEKLGEVRAEIKKEQQKAPVLALVVGLVISANLCCIGCLCVVCGLSPHLMARSRGFRSAGIHDDEGVALRPRGRAPPSADEEAVE